VHDTKCCKIVQKYSLDWWGDLAIVLHTACTLKVAKLLATGLYGYKCIVFSYFSEIYDIK